MLDDFFCIKTTFSNMSFQKRHLFYGPVYFINSPEHSLLPFQMTRSVFFHHILVQTSFIGTGAIPFNIHPLRFGRNFPRAI